MAGSNGSSNFSHLQQTHTTLILAGILVILALLLVEFKRMTTEDKGIVIRVADGRVMDVSLPEIPGYLGTSNAPIWMRAVPNN